MIKKIILFSLILYGVYANAQQISGTISNLEDKTLIFSWTNNFLVYERDTILADKNGNFKLNIPLKHAGYLTLRINNFLSDDIYVWPSATLHITADGKTGTTYYNSRKYNGSAELINNFFAFIQTSNVLKEHSFGGKTYKLSEEKFITAITTYFEKRDSLKQAYFKTASIHKNDQILKDFLLTDSINMVYFKATAWFSYLNYLDKETSDNFFSVHIKTLAKQNDNIRYLSAPHYRNFWSNLISYKLDKIRDLLPPTRARLSSTYYQNIPVLIATHLKGQIKQIVASAYLQNITSYSYIEEDEAKTADTATEKLYIQLNNKKVENDYRKLFSEKTKFRSLIKKGLPAKDFNVIDTNGKSYNLKDFRGKIVYVDLWASWCGPCIAEIPETKKMLAAIKSPEKLIYLSISLDDKKNDWMGGLKIHQPPGLQFWAINGLKSNLAVDYKINGLPHYILIDEHGQFINYTAPRPSSGSEIIDLINQSTSAIKH